MLNDLLYAGAIEVFNFYGRFNSVYSKIDYFIADTLGGSSFLSDTSLRESVLYSLIMDCVREATVSSWVIFNNFMANYVNKNAATQVLEEIYIYISKEIAHVTRDITNVILSQLHQTLIHLTTNLVSSAAHDTIFIPYASIYTSLYRNSVEESKNDKPGTFPHHLFRLTH